MNRCLICVAGLFIGLLTSTRADGQIVRVGPAGGVRVRAPFVRVDVLPFGGGTRVRAPFTSVRTGAYGYGYAPPYRRPYAYHADPYYAQPYGYPQPYIAEPVYVEPVVYAAPIYTAPVGVQPAESAVDRLIASAKRLEASLETRRDDADIWIDYLQPQQIIALAKPGKVAGKVSDSLALLLNNYEGVAANRSLSSISSAPGFRATFDLLRQYVGAAGETDTDLNPPANQQPAAMEPKLAKPVELSAGQSDGDSESDTDDPSGGEESVLLPPEGQ